MTVLEREEERENVIDILRKTKKAMKTKDVVLLKELSSRTIHSASIYKDVDSVMVAVIVYALSKILERKKYTTYKDWPTFFGKVNKAIEKALTALENRDLKTFRASLKEIRAAVNALSGRLKKYIKEVFRKAKINKASRIYEHGISASQTAKLLGITEFELAEYVGNTGIADVDLSITMPIEKRIKLAESLFEKE